MIIYVVCCKIIIREVKLYAKENNKKSYGKNICYKCCANNINKLKLI